MLHVDMDEQLKKEFEAWCEAVGMNSSTAVNIFVKKVLCENELPFKITVKPAEKIPNSLTQKTLRESEKGENLESTSVEKLFKVG